MDAQSFRSEPVARLRSRRWLTRGSVCAAAAVGLAAAMAAPAGAAPGDQSSDTTQANVQVASSITLTGLTPSFTLSGLPGDVVTEIGAVSFRVTTNNIAGYTVTVQAQTATLVPETPGNPDSIPIANLRVRETADGNTGAFTSLSSTSTVLVHSQGVESAAVGDELSNDYQVDIPFVNSDTYSATLSYVATAS
jgi:hypothetical protein